MNLVHGPKKKVKSETKKPNIFDTPSKKGQRSTTKKTVWKFESIKCIEIFSGLNPSKSFRYHLNAIDFCNSSIILGNAQSKDQYQRVISMISIISTELRNILKKLKILSSSQGLHITSIGMSLPLPLFSNACPKFLH